MKIDHIEYYSLELSYFEMMKLKMFLQLAKNTCEMQENKDICEKMLEEIESVKI